MTDAQNVSPGLLTAAAEVAAERFGMPMIGGDRAILIAALHTVINWLIDHPNIPCPQDIELRFHPRGGVQPTGEDLIRLAEDLDGRVSAGSNSQWVATYIPLGDGADGVSARYTAFGRDRCDVYQDR